MCEVASVKSVEPSVTISVEVKTDSGSAAGNENIETADSASTEHVCHVSYDTATTQQQSAPNDSPPPATTDADADADADAR